MLRKVTSTAARSALRSNVGVIPFAASPAIARREYSSKRRNFAIVATGVGFLDGTDVTECSSLMIHFGEVGFNPVFFAPEGTSEETIDHATRDVDKNEIRDIHAEVTRISRNKVVPLKTLRSKAGEALVIPGGGGLAMLLPGFSENNTNFGIDPSLEAAIKEFHDEGKPIIATSNGVIAVARVLGTKNGGPGVKLSVGDDSELEEIVRGLGCTPVETKIHQSVTDEEHKVISTGGFANRAATFHDVHKSVGQAVESMASVARGVKDIEIDWEFHDFYITKARGYSEEEWAIIKEDIKGMLERQQKKMMED